MANYEFNSHSKKLDEFFNSSDDGVFYVGHASILARLSGKTFLFDAVCQRPPYLESWVFYPPQVMDRRLLEVDAVFVSHCHQDHFDTDFLKQLPKTTPIYIVGGRPDFKKMFDDAGLKVTEIPPQEVVQLPEGVEAYGILHEYNSIDSSVVIRNEKFSVYHGNDNFVTKKSLDPLMKAIGTVDVACVPFSFIHWYPFLLEGVDETWKRAEAKRLIEMYLDLGIEQGETLKSKLVIPFGANLVYHDSADSVMNKAVLSPIDFVEYARTKLSAERGQAYMPMFADDYVLASANGALKIEMRERSKEEFLRELDTYLKSRPKNYVELENVEAVSTSDMSWLSEKLMKRDLPSMNHVIRVESGGSHSEKIEIDLDSKSVRVGSEWTTDKPYHHFVVEPVALDSWLKKKITFEEVIGTRRFRVFRVPNEYNLKVLEVINNVL